MRKLAILLIVATASAALAQQPVRPHVLVANDDGIDAPGIAALVNALKDGYRITVCAPADEQSGVGHAITYRTPVQVDERPPQDGIVRYAIHARPASCVRIGVTALLASDPPVMVLSGINRGGNTGRSVWVSGTVAAAREGALAGLPAVAFSAEVAPGRQPDWAAAGRWARIVLDRLRAHGLPRAGQVIKVEIPDPAAAVKGIEVTRASLAPAAEDRYEERPGPHGERLFVSRWKARTENAPGTDAAAIADGWIAVTPLSLDQTDYRSLTDLVFLMRPELAPAAAP